jgi:DNA-directed RNA polymerase
VKSVAQGYYNPVVKQHLTYRVNIPSEEAQALKDRHAMHYRGFYPNFVHSIDGALMRMIIRDMYDRTGYRIGHIHDCILLHPNFVDDLYIVLHNIYTKTLSKSFIDNLFFEPMKEGLASDIKDRISSVQVKFHEIVGENPLDLVDFNPRDAYTMEGSVNPRDVHLKKNLFTL